MDFTTEHLPNVNDLHPAYEGEALILRGYAADWRLDRAGDTIAPSALDTAVKTYLATNPVLLYQHKKNLPPIGKVLKAEVHRAKGLWIEALLPRPAGEGFAAEVWDSAKNGLLKAFSIGGKFLRTVGSRIVSVDLQEVSLASVALNPHTYADSVTPVHVKALADGTWRPVDSINGRVHAAIRAHERARAQQQRQQLDATLLTLDVASMHARSRQLRQPAL